MVAGFCFWLKASVLLHFQMKELCSFGIMKEDIKWYGLLLLLAVMIIGMTFSITHSFLVAGIVMLALLGLTIRNLLRERKCRREHPKDYAYYIYSEWGPAGRIPRLQRLQQKLPDIDEIVLNEWIKEFSSIEEWIWRIASAGGSYGLGKMKTKELLQSKFPFLVMFGLQHACFLVGYYTWHEGYDKEPQIKADEI